MFVELRGLSLLSAAMCLSIFLACASARADALSVAIATIEDDMEESLEDNTTFDIGSSDLELGTEGPPEPRQAVGLRFLNIGIPPQSTISSASIQFMVDEADDEDTTVRIYGELSPNSGPFTLVPSDISGRPRTTNSVLWSDIPLWTNEGDSGPDQLTPDLSALVQEIIDQPSWAMGNAMTFVILPDPIDDNTGERTAISFDKAMGNPAFNPPILNVEFTPIPEPTSLALASIALGLFVCCRRNRASDPVLA